MLKCIYLLEEHLVAFTAFCNLIQQWKFVTCLSHPVEAQTASDRMPKNIHRVWCDFSGLKYFSCDELVQQNQFAHAILSFKRCKRWHQGKWKCLEVSLGLNGQRNTIVFYFYCRMWLSYYFFLFFNTSLSKFLYWFDTIYFYFYIFFSIPK